MDLTNKVAVVTGGASGIGQATCDALAGEGIKAIGVVDQCDVVGEICSATNADIGREVLIPFQGDVTDESFREAVFAELEAGVGSASICVPCAGITRDRLSVKTCKDNGQSSLDLYPMSDFRRVLDVDLVAPIYWALHTIGAVAKERAERGMGRWEPDERVQGCVVFIGSVSSAGNKGQISYATAKAGLEGAQATLAMEAIFYGVRCAIIHPGYTDTPMVRAMGQKLIADVVLPNTQLRRLIRPQEIANAICFMIHNSAVTGALWADAGWHPSA